MTPLLTAREVADRLGLSKDWVWAQARAGTIPHVRLGRYRRFRAEAIEAWIVELEASNNGARRPRTARRALKRGRGAEHPPRRSPIGRALRRQHKARSEHSVPARQRSWMQQLVPYRIEPVAKPHVQDRVVPGG